MARRNASPARRFFRLRGGSVEICVGMLLASFMQARAAAAATADLPASDEALANVDAPLPEALAKIDPDAIATLSPEELQQLLDAKALAQLGLDPAEFARLLDSDLEEALKQLEAAFRKKLKLAAAGESTHLADSEIRAAAHSDGDDDGAHMSDLGEGSSLLLILGGLAVGGLGIALAGGGGGSDDAGEDNALPTAATDAITTAEDAPVTFDVRANDTDADGDSLTVTQINGTAISTTNPVAITGGTISLGADGRLTFTPAANFNGAPSFNYTVSDGHGGTASGSVNLTVTPVNDAPAASADSFTTNEDTAVTINVRSNDTDVEGSALTVTHVNNTPINAQTPVAVTGGVVTLVNGNLVFTPAANYNGAPTFTYTVSDGNASSNATVTGTVTAVNDAPVNAAPEAVAGTQGAGIQIGGLAVADADGGTLTTTITVATGTLSAATVQGGATIAGAGTGTLTLTGTAAQINATLGGIGFNGGPAFFGRTTLTITTSDGQVSDSDSVDISVARVIDGIVQDGYIAGATVFIDVDGDGELDEGEPSTVTDADGNFVLSSNLPGLIVAIGGTNTDTGLPNTIALKAPVGATVISPITTLVAEMVQAGSSIEQAKAAVAQALGIPASVDLTSFDFLAPTDDPELAALAVAVQKSATQIVTVLATAQAAASEGSGAAVQAAVLAKLVEAVSSGQAVDLTDVATIGQMLDGIQGIPAENLEQVKVQVTAVNQTIAAATSASEIANTVVTLSDEDADLPPITVTDLVSAAEDGGSVSFNVIANDIDDSGDPVTLKSVNGVTVEPGAVVAVAGGTITVGEAGQLSFTPDANFNGKPSFKYVIEDSAGNLQTGTVKLDIAGVNDGPVANADGISTLQNGAITFDPRANDSDVDGDTLQVTHINGSAISATSPVAIEGGTISLGTDGRLTFTPTAGYVGAPSFTYTVSDGHGGTASARIDANVLEPSNVAPVAVADTIAAAEDVPVTFDLRGNDTDANGDALSVVEINGVSISVNNPVVTDQGTFRMDDSGAITFAPAGDFNGTISFTYKAVDGRGGSSTGSGKIEVAAVNDAPTAVADSFTTLEDAPVTINVRGNDTDVEGSALTVTHVNGTSITAQSPVAVSGGVVSLVDGNLVFTPASNFNGSPSFTYTVRDAQGATSTASVTGIVQAVNDAPVAAADAASTIAGQPVLIDVLANDGDVEGQALSVVAINGQQFPASGGVQVEGGTVTLSDGKLVFTPNEDFTGRPSFTYTVSDGNGGTATGNVSVTVAADPVLDIAPAEFPQVLADIDALAAAGVETLDVAGDVLAISGAQANVLLGAGVDFAEADTITVQASGTNFNTSLKGLQQLHVDSVAITGDSLVVDAGASLGSLSAAGLPQFDVAQTDAALDVTLNVAAGSLGSGFDAAAMAGALAAAGIDHIGVAGPGGLTLDQAQALAFDGARLDFVNGADITLQTGGNGVANLDVAMADRLNVDHIDVTGNGAATISDAKASDLLNAGLDFVESDTITVGASGTHLSTSLKGLQQLHVDSVAVTGSAIIVDAGDALGSLSAAGLPQFDIAQSDAALDVTLNIAPGSLGGGYDLAGLASALGTAGIDHLGIAGSGALTLDQAQAQALDTAGLDFANRADITLQTDANGFANLDVAMADRLNVDHIDVTGDGIGTISDTNASALLNAGVDFLESDTITVQASGTHLNTSLKGLQQLHVDSVAVSGGTLVVDAGASLGSLSAAGLPQFDVAQGDAALDVTLNIASGSLGAGYDLAGIAGALGAAGIDHLGISGSGALALNQAQAQTLDGAGLDFANSANITLQSDANGVVNLDVAMADRLNIDHLDVTGGGAVTISEGKAAALLNAGIDFVEADTITVAAGGTHLSTSLKGLQQLHVDSVAVSGGAIIVDAGASLDSLSAAGLPQFDVAQADAALDVTLNIGAGSIANGGSIAAIAGALGGAGIDHISVGGSGAFSLNLAQAQALDAAGIDFLSGANITLVTDAGGAAGLDLAMVDRLNVDHIDISGNGVATISDAQAGGLLSAGVDFAEADTIRVQASGTHLETSLKGLQQLHVDTIAAANGPLVVQAGDGGLGALSASGLPQFDVAQHGSALDVTLNINPGSIGSGFDLAGLANALGNAGIDHIGVNGNGALSLTQAQALAIDNAGLDFANGANVTLVTDAAGAAGLSAVTLNRLNIDHIDLSGDGVLTIGDARAGQLLSAGVDFAEADTITVQAEGTHLSTTLKGLQQLHVDSIAATGALAIDVGEGGLLGLASSGLPQFDLAQNDASLDVTLNVTGGILAGPLFNGLWGALGAAGVDHIHASGASSIGYGEATAFAAAGLSFTDSSDVTLYNPSFHAVDLGLLAQVNVDHLAVGSAAITDAQAAAMINAGVDFATSDIVAVNAGGTHLSTSLKDLQALHVDSVHAAAGESVLHLDAGDLSQVVGTGLPQFHNGTNLDVTLNVDAEAVDDLERLAAALRVAGVDHFAIAEVRSAIDVDVLARLDAIAQQSGIDFVFGAQSAGAASGFSLLGATEEQSYDHGRVYQEILTSFEAADQGGAADIEIADGAAAALAESGVLRTYLSDHLVVDATASGDRLLTTLKDVAEIGIDEIRTVGQHGQPVYVDLGLSDGGSALEEIKTLFKNLDVNFDGPERLFSGSEKVALVLDAPAAEAIAHVDGGFEQLAELGFTEVDVLAAPDGFTLDTQAVEIKLIGQQDDLYDYLHHNR